MVGVGNGVTVGTGVAVPMAVGETASSPSCGARVGVAAAPVGEFDGAIGVETAVSLWQAANFNKKNKKMQPFNRKNKDDFRMESR